MKEETDAQLLAPFIPDTVEMGDRPSDPNELPREALVWQLDLTTDDNGQIELTYPKVAHVTVSSPEDFDGLLNQIIDDATALTWKSPDQKPTMRTALSIENKNNCYMIFVLQNDRNWQFASNHVPFEVKRGKEGLYLAATAMTSEGTTGRLRVINPDERPRHGSKIAYFIANSAHELSTDNFATPFNIYVDILVTLQDGQKCPVPVVIDPDVGHPGGHG